MIDQLRKFMGLDGFRELVKAAKSPSDIDTSKIAVVSAMPTETKALGGEDSRLIEFIITSDRVDRDQDTINPDGWKFEDYEKNPVVLWCHDHYAMPIANARSLTRSGNKWKSIAEFTPKELCGGFGYMTYQMYAKGFMHACSVGFMPVAYTLSADRKYGINYQETALLEYSCVPVPSNPDALVVARSMGVDTAPLKLWAEKVLDESRSGPAHLGDDARHRLEILRAASSPSGRALIVELGDMKMAGTDKPNELNPPAPSTTSSIKQVARWECGTKGHTHETENEATTCAHFDVSVTEATKQLQLVLATAKAGQVLRPEAKALLVSIMKELAPEAAKEGEQPIETETTDDKENEDEILRHLGEMPEAELRSLVAGAFSDAFNERTGRVD